MTSLDCISRSGRHTIICVCRARSNGIPTVLLGKLSTGGHCHVARIGLPGKRNLPNQKDTLQVTPSHFTTRNGLFAKTRLVAANVTGPLDGRFRDTIVLLAIRG